MNSKNVVIGDYYRHRTTPKYAWAKVLQVIKPLPKHAQKIYYGREDANPYTYIIVKCEWSLDKNASFGLIKYFKLSDLIVGK